ncbi:MAG: acylaldehyde oxidase [Massilia sp.]|jgi:xanthine dehydrogenase YagR molybdenum-binding subunit|nr:acylaldehyde oxidase [Massilia sp.]
MNIIGQGMDRTDGRLKVSGAAMYSAEHAIPHLAQAVMVQTTIASGRIETIDDAKACAMPGVLLVMTHLNAPRIRGKSTLSLLQDDTVQYNGQPIAVVVADTLEHAQDAARHIQLRYTATPAVLSFDDAKTSPRPTSKPDFFRGDPTAGERGATTNIDTVYTTPIESHNPMEPHATIAVWEGDALTLYDSTQSVSGVRDTVAETLGIAADKVRVVCPFVGGGFGCKGETWSHVLLAAMASKLAGRPVKLALERTQLVGPIGMRPMTEQRIRLGAASDGKLGAVIHNTISSTSFVDDFPETCGDITKMLYSSASVQTTQRMAPLNLGPPTYMRAPGESTGSFALESALDELAYALHLDPIELRLRNYAERDPTSDLPFSSKSLRECYRVGAERFGWPRRTAEPCSMRAGRTMVGWGMATASYPAHISPARASASIRADGTALVRSGSQDLGTGTYTVMTQIAAEALGMAVSKVTFELGDTGLPEAPASGGSQTVASVGPAVYAAAKAARDRLVGMAVSDALSPLHGLAADDVIADDGWLIDHKRADRRESMVAVIERHGGHNVTADGRAGPGDVKKRFAMHSFGAVFVEVHVDPDLGTIRVPRVVGAYGVGRLINKKTGHSQLMGGIVWGLGMGLMEKTEFDWRTGRPLNSNLADYHVPVNADINDIDITVVEEDDPHVNVLGAKGIGEIGIVGVAAALANAVYHATGKRIRDLPITLDKLL